MKNLQTYEAFLNEAKTKLPSWYKGFEKKLADKLDIEPRDLWLEYINQHLLKVGADFSQEGLDSFPTAVRSVLRTPEFKGKMTFISSERDEERILKKHPELEDYIYNEEYFWIYVK